MTDAAGVGESLDLITASEAETRAVGRRLAEALGPGARIGLAGELGAGKTCLVRGLAEGLGVPSDQVRSPSFPIVLPYEGGRLPLFHIDLFRLPAANIDSVALREYIYGSGVCAVEWYERLDEPMLDFLAISLHFAGGDRRRLTAAVSGKGYAEALEVLLEISRQKR